MIPAGSSFLVTAISSEDSSTLSALMGKIFFYYYSIILYRDFDRQFYISRNFSIFYFLIEFLLLLDICIWGILIRKKYVLWIFPFGNILLLENILLIGNILLVENILLIENILFMKLKWLVLRRPDGHWGSRQQTIMSFDLLYFLFSDFVKIRKKSIIGRKSIIRKNLLIEKVLFIEKNLFIEKVLFIEKFYS